MRRNLRSCLLLLLLVAVPDCAWAACDAQGENFQIATQACRVCENEFPGQDSEVDKVIAAESVMWVCLGDRLIEELNNDKDKLSDLIRDIRDDPNIQWEGEIRICSSERGECPWVSSH